MCQVSGLQLIFRLISRVPWRRLAELAGHPDMFNIMSLGVPIIVNALESSKESMRIVADECRTYTTPQSEDERISGSSGIFLTTALSSSPLCRCAHAPR